MDGDPNWPGVKTLKAKIKPGQEAKKGRENRDKMSRKSGETRKRRPKIEPLSNVSQPPQFAMLPQDSAADSSIKRGLSHLTLCTPPHASDS